MSEMQTFNFTFNAQQLSVISAALLELPYKVSAPVIAEFQKQITEQQGAENGSAK